MNCQMMVLKELDNYSFNQLIIASQVYAEKFADSVREVTFYKSLERLVKKNLLYHFSKGVYCKVKMGRFGLIRPSEDEISKSLVSNQKGMYIGYQLYNQLGLTTQVSKKIELFTCQYFKQKNIGNIVLRTVPIVFSEANRKMIEILEVLKNLEKIQDLSVSNLQNYLRSFVLNEYNDNDFEFVYSFIPYPKYVINRLKQVLDHYQVPNQLNRYLSTLSKYKETKVALYETPFG